jgi:hypothetical protein
VQAQMGLKPKKGNGFPVDLKMDCAGLDQVDEVDVAGHDPLGSPRRRRSRCRCPGTAVDPAVLVAYIDTLGTSIGQMAKSATICARPSYLHHTPVQR